MIDTKITKKPTKQHFSNEDFAALEVNDQKRLVNAIIGHGNLKKAVMSTGLTNFTIKRAAMGFRVNPDTMDRIKKYLQAHG